MKPYFFAAPVARMFKKPAKRGTNVNNKRQDVQNRKDTRPLSALARAQRPRAFAYF